jgi:hypothetical protein
MGQPLLAKYYCVRISISPLPGGSYFRAIRQVKYLRISPMSMIFEIKGRAALI